MLTEATVIEFKIAQLKKTKIEQVKLLIEEKEINTSLMIAVPFLYSSFPAMIYYNKTILIGHKLNIVISGDSVSPEEYKVKVVPWEQQDIHLREKIYSLFFEAMSEVYFSKAQNGQFKKEFDRYKRRRRKENNESVEIPRKLELIRNRRRLERIFRLDLGRDCL